jgi:hypothetical protein
MQTFGRFALIARILRLETEDAIGTGGSQFAVQISKGAALRRAPSGARNIVPSFRQRGAGAPGHRIDEHYRSAHRL